MSLEPMASLARGAMTALQVPAATESAAATRRVVGSALKAVTRRSFQQGARSTSEKTEVLRWVQRQPAAGMAEYLKHKTVTSATPGYSWDAYGGSG